MDVHRDLLVTTIKTEDGKETKWSGVSNGDLNSLMDWLREKRCHKGVMESSGIILGYNLRSTNIQRVPRDGGQRASG